jgi:hypothetical protein
MNEQIDTKQPSHRKLVVSEAKLADACRHASVGVSRAGPKNGKE